MIDFNKYLERHGEPGVQSLIEMIERREGNRANAEAPLLLEERWNDIMRQPVSQQRVAA